MKKILLLISLLIGAAIYITIKFILRGIKMIRISIHSQWKIWYKYLLPKRLTLKCNPPIYRWLIWCWDKKDCRFCTKFEQVAENYIRCNEEKNENPNGCGSILYVEKPCKYFEWRKS